MRSVAILLAASAILATGAAGAVWSVRAARPPDPAARSALAPARGEGARARERAAALDRQARTATLASARAAATAAALGARVQQTEAALAGADAQLALVRGQRQALDRRLARERAPVLRLLAGLQRQVRRPALLTLLQPGSIEDAVHLRAAYAAIRPQIAARTGELKSALEQSRALEREAAQLTAQHKALRADLLARRTELAAISETERLKARRAAGAADREAERAFAVGEQARDLTTLLRGLKSAGRRPDIPRRSIAANAEGPSPYRLPVAGPIAPLSGRDGVFVQPLPNALVVAPAAGRVAFAGSFRGYGAIVIVEHADGWTSLITGLATTQVVVGQALVAGTPLGQAPPGAAQIGLELRRNGQRVNPLDQMR